MNMPKTASKPKGKTIGEHLITMIRSSGMTQKDFSERTGIPQSTISDWKGKKLNPSSDKILPICDVLGVSPYEVLAAGRKGKKYNPDRIEIRTDSEEYALLELYRSLPARQKERVVGYIQAIRDEKKNR